MSDSETRSHKLLDKLRHLPTAAIYEAAGKTGGMAPCIRRQAGARSFAGYAFTVRTLPGDNLAVFHAISQAKVGDVLVIDAGDTSRVTIWGGTSSIAAQTKGIVACVTNAAIRDVDEINDMGFPVFATAISVRGALKNHLGWLNEPVSVGGVIVHSGDIVVGDGDGVVVLAQNHLESLIDKAVELQEAHAVRDQRLRSGEPIEHVMNL
jgi:4-hydroxy-4-methyl-2-oxoglutarate aldolase